MRSGTGIARLDEISILLVEDHDLVAQSFARVLSDQADLRVVGIASTQEGALRAVSDLKPAVVLMDYALPDGNGASAAREVLRRAPDTKVIMLTGSGNPAAQLAALTAGCSAFLEKTSATAELVRTVRRVSAGEVVMPSEGTAQLPAIDELVVHYQPIVDLRSEATVGVEALVRWAHPLRGLVSPLEFVGLAEQTGYVCEIGDWVLDQAVQQAMRWQREVPHVPLLDMSVNVSPRQLASREFVPHVLELRERSRLAEDLTIEVTETALLENSDTVMRELQSLTAEGVRIALDDFGTGYSSLTYLRQFPIDVIKIDRSFISDLPGDSRSRLLANTICSLADELNVATVAEGIETEEQASCLRELGATMGQGFYFARPQPAAELLPALIGSA
jgi:EAL domain-containing protein (putative c-di-GMP-specific phosphodiesterase class I)